MVLWAGWALGLGFRLEPCPSPDRVPGWRIAHTSAEAITLELRSRLIATHDVVLIQDSWVRWAGGTLQGYGQRSVDPRHAKVYCVLTGPFAEPNATDTNPVRTPL